MPQRFANGFDPEAVRAMMAAFEKACEELGLATTDDAVTEKLAQTLVRQLVTSGERDPDRLCAMTLRVLDSSG